MAGTKEDKGPITGKRKNRKIFDGIVAVAKEDKGPITGERKHTEKSSMISWLEPRKTKDRSQGKGNNKNIFDDMILCYDLQCNLPEHAGVCIVCSFVVQAHSRMT